MSSARGGSTSDDFTALAVAARGLLASMSLQITFLCADEYEDWPYTFAVIAAESFDVTARRAKVDEFYALPMCCLEATFARKVRRESSTTKPRPQFVWTISCQPTLANTVLATAGWQDRTSGLLQTFVSNGPPNHHRETRLEPQIRSHQRSSFGTNPKVFSAGAGHFHNR